MILQSKIPQGVSMGYHQCEKCCWSPAKVRIKAQDGQIHLLSRCLLQPRTLGALLPNEYFCLRNESGFPPLCMSSLYQSCLWPWVLVCLGFQQFAAWWFAVGEFDERNVFSRTKVQRSTNAYNLSMDTWLRTFSGDLYHHPSLGEYPEIGEVIRWSVGSCHLLFPLPPRCPL